MTIARLKAQRDARQALDNLGKERFARLTRQLQASMRSAQEAGDAETIAELRLQVAALAERHRRFYPPPSPYFLDSRSNRTPA